MHPIAGELAISKVGSRYFVVGEVDGDADTDFSIQVIGTKTFEGGDFLL